MERHFGAALSEVSSQRLDVAKQHAAAVTAALNAVNAYTEWAPLPDLAKYGIIRGYDIFIFFFVEPELALLVYLVLNAVSTGVASYFVLLIFACMPVNFSSLSLLGMLQCYARSAQF